MSIDPVRKQITVRATPERAFTVFASGAWWPPEHTILASGSPRKELIIEPREGGRWYEVGEDDSHCDWGRVILWDAPRRMILGWEINGDFEPDPSATTELEVNFIPEGESTRVELEHRGFERYLKTGQALRDAVGGDSGWAGLLKKFGAAAELKSAPTKRYFVCKLVLPRATFMQDTSKREGEAIAAHAGYWSQLTETRQAVLFGPVGDPAGPWGLGILHVADEAEASRIAQEDPAVLAGLGIRQEVYPMLQTVVAG